MNATFGFMLRIQLSVMMNTYVCKCVKPYMMWCCTVLYFACAVQMLSAFVIEIIYLDWMR